MLYHAMTYLRSVPGSATHNFLQVPLRPPMVFLFDPTLCEQVTLWLKSFSSTDCIVYISPTKIFETRFIAQLALNLSDQVLTRWALSRYVKVHQPIFHPTRHTHHRNLNLQTKMRSRHGHRGLLVSQKEEWRQFRSKVIFLHFFSLNTLLVLILSDLSQQRSF